MPDIVAGVEVITEEARDLVERGELKPGPGTIRIFRSPLAETLTRSPPWLPFAWIPPAIAAATEHWGMHLGAFATGAAGWVILEYLLHRFFFHLPGTSRAARGVRFLAHEHHHHRPEDPSRLVATPWQLALALALVVPFAQLGPSPPMTLAGTLVAYLAYEAIHYRIHHATRPGRLMKRLRAHHLRHHAPDGHRAGFGISSPVLDVLLGTTHATRPRT